MSEPMTVVQLVSQLLDAGFADRDGTYGEAVVQVTLDGEHFFALTDLVDYGDGGVVLTAEPWPW